MTFQRIYEYIIDKVPQLAPRNTYVVHEWLAQGYNYEKDIVPAIDKATKNGSKFIHSFAFFSGFIKTQHVTRIKEQHKPKEQTQSEKDAIRAKNIRWHKDRGVQSTSIGPHDYQWLQEYERNNQVTA